MKDKERERRREAEHRQVEDELERSLSSHEQDCERGTEELGDDELTRRDEVEAEYQAQLAEREAVRLAAEMNVNRESLRQKEDGSERKPGDVWRSRGPLKV
jgi:hypothetical protein